MFSERELRIRGRCRAGLGRNAEIGRRRVRARLPGQIDAVRVGVAGRVHGDLSAYNVLFHDGSPVVIDFPQACDPRFNVLHPNLCPALRWKGQFVLAPIDESAQQGTDTNYWCLYTQNCIGPDGIVAELRQCDTQRRANHL